MHILAYAERYVMLAYWELCYIDNFAISRTRGIFRILFIIYRNINFLFFTLISHTFQQNLKRHMFLNHNDASFNAWLSLLK